MKAAADDATVLRIDPSLSGSASGASSGGAADAPRVLKQRFVLVEKLGSGGMGTVFRAKDLRKVEARDRNPYVAVKVLNNDFREHPEAFIALQREATKSQALSHRNIVSIYDFDKDGDVPFIIMELLEGRELAELLRAYPTGLPDEIAWPVIRCLCDGLEHAHEAGLVHADFKPGNVYVADNHSAKILDFGIARAVQINHSGTEEDTVFDPTRLAALTPAYASPQMLEGAEADQRDDLFSLGVVIYLMITGQHPYGRVAADEAARQGLKPERPRRLSRRQWRVVERCLAFDRERRPASLAEVKKHLLQPSPWRSRTVVVALAAVVASFLVSNFKEEAAVQEAKVEARQTTLVDSQLSRLATLLASPSFERGWEDKVAEEVGILRSLQPPGAPEPPVLARVRQRYGQEIDAAIDPDRAIALYQRALSYGPMAEAAEHLQVRLANHVEALLDGAVLDDEWMNQLDRAFRRLNSVFPGSSRLAALQLDTVDVLEAKLDESLAGDRFPPARRALAFLETYSFGTDTVDSLKARVDAAEQAYAARQAAAQRQTALTEFHARLRAALAGTCLSFDPGKAAAVFASWVRRQPDFAGPGRAQVGEHVSRCVAQLQAVDGERAHALEQRSLALFSHLPGVEPVREDPCGAGYLVGSGNHSGRRGSCVDRIGDSGQGPRLVVVPGAVAGDSFAMTRAEVSWGELAPFCRETGRCPVPAEADLPVSGITVELARGYARWLSDKTGFAYRLPTYREWRMAAKGTVDPNRNCQVQLGGLTRGLAPVAVGTGTPNPYGLVNMLGNVQEWVVDDGQLKAAGGAFRDPIAECVVATLREQHGEPDPATGFRLVRELS